MLTRRTEQVEGITGGTEYTTGTNRSRRPPGALACRDGDTMSIAFRGFNWAVALARTVVGQVVVRRTRVTQLASSKDEHLFIVPNKHPHRLATCPIPCRATPNRRSKSVAWNSVRQQRRNGDRGSEVQGACNQWLGAVAGTCRLVLRGSRQPPDAGGMSGGLTYSAVACGLLSRGGSSA